jgi:hypothetical protein
MLIKSQTSLMLILTFELFIEISPPIDSFGGTLAPSLNGVDPSFVNSVAGTYLYSQVAQISYMILWLL